MDAVNDTHTPQFVDFGWDELVPAAIIDATFSNLQTYAEPSRATSSAETEERIVHGSTRIEDLTSSISSAAQNTPHATPPRAKIIPKAEWERYRPIIEKLYVAQGLTLSTTREILAEDHGFVAE
jgi:hypothetical protein